MLNNIIGSQENVIKHIIAYDFKSTRFPKINVQQCHLFLRMKKNHKLDKPSNLNHLKKRFVLSNQVKDLHTLRSNNFTLRNIPFRNTTMFQKHTMSPQETSMFKTFILKMKEREKEKGRKVNLRESKFY